MDARELARRRPVWKALSDLFLDTEARPWIPSMALVVLDAGYSDDEMRRIWRNEIVPEFSPNLLSIAGEWADLPLDEESLVARAEGGGSMLGAVASKNAPSLDEQLEAVLAVRRVLGETRPEARGELAHELGKVLDVWVDGAIGGREPASEAIRPLVGAAFRRLQPTFVDLLIGERRATAAERVALVERFLGC